MFLPTPPAAGLLKCELHKGNPCVWSSRFSVRLRCRQKPNRSVHPPLAAGLRPHLNAKHSTQVSEPGIISFRSHCPFPHPAKLASMKRKFARRSARATPPAPAAPADSRESVAATAPRPDAEIPGRIDSDSVREENQTGSNPMKANPSQCDRIKPKKIKNPRILCIRRGISVVLRLQASSTAAGGENILKCVGASCRNFVWFAIAVPTPRHPLGNGNGINHGTHRAHGRAGTLDSFPFRVLRVFRGFPRYSEPIQSNPNHKSTPGALTANPVFTFALPGDLLEFRPIKDRGGLIWQHHGGCRQCQRG